MGSGAEFETLVDIFHRAVKNYASRPLFGTKRDGAWSWTTYEQFGRAVDRARSGLAALGLNRGDCIAMVSNNRVEWAVVAYACYGLGIVFVPMYEAQSVDEWKFIVADCEAKALVVAGAANLEKALGLFDVVPSLKTMVSIAAAREGSSNGVFDARTMTYEALVNGPPAAASIQPSPDDLATLIYTSGTTGNPKGVMLTHRNIASNVNAIHAVLALGADDRSLAFLPWAHVFGQTAELHHLLSAGASMALSEGPDKILENLAEVRPTILFSVPRIFNRLYIAVQQQLSSKPRGVQKLVAAALRVAARKREGHRLGLSERALLALADKLVFTKVRARLGGRLRYASSGGAALSREVAEFIDAFGIVVFEGYGLTETSPVVATNYPGVRKIGTVGPVIPGVRVVIDPGPLQDASGASSGSSAVEGEIIVYGPNVMKGYYKRPDDTAAAFTSDGGFRTGDIGCLDADGFLSITGRLKEQYKLENGKYVIPASLEEQLKLSPYIANALVYGDNRPYNVALIVPNATAVKKWADDQQVPVPAQTDAMLANERVRALFGAEIAKYASTFKGFEKIRNFELLSDDFTTDNGLLTPKMSLRRRNVIERYKDALDRLYSNQSRGSGSNASAA
ncbi:MAG TPA: long-chain fatty acid--CoA ligase [Polyangiaceae bacterium]|nr:long-chain fatty acid--CoA ligase [Polyangiaceae bacterium]